MFKCSSLAMTFSNFAISNPIQYQNWFENDFFFYCVDNVGKRFYLKFFFTLKCEKNIIRIRFSSLCKKIWFISLGNHCTFLKLQGFFQRRLFKYVHFFHQTKKKLANDSITIWTIRFHNKYFFVYCRCRFPSNFSNSEAIKNVLPRN